MLDDANEDNASQLARRVGESDVVRKIYDQLPVLTFAVDGPEHRIVATNAGYRQAMGREELVGLTYREAVPEVVGQQVFETLDRVYETGQPESGRAWRAQYDRTGTGELDELFFDFTVSPRRDSHGQVIGMSVVAFDVTEQERARRQAQRETAEAEQRYEQARDVITSLQRQLLPPGLPVLPSVRLAGSYLLADGDNAAGGDWFDAVPLSDGRVALVVGDVVGHGVAASAAMGQLRAVLQDRLDETGDILTALAAADRMATRVPDAHAATVCITVLDPVDGTLVYGSAGHPPPLVITLEEPRYLPASGCGPLGTQATYTVAKDQLGVGEVVLLYSDGIIERPGRRPAAATAELATVAADTVAGRALRDPGLDAVERACTQIPEMLVRATGHTDDITLLAAQRITPVEPLHLRLDADLPAITTSRLAVHRWLREHAVGHDDHSALQHAVIELVTNAVEHSHPDSVEGTVTVTGTLDPAGVARINVTDDGHWHERARPNSDQFRRDHGIGLALTSQLVDHLDISHSPNGTTATVHHRLTHPARLLTADHITHGRGPTDARQDPPEPTLIVDQPHASASRIAVHGPLDATTSDHFAHELDRLTLGHTHPLTIDLTAVTHLASAAVAVLHRATTHHTTNTALRLYAPAGSPAHHILALVNLPHTTTDPTGPASPNHTTHSDPQHDPEDHQPAP
ncbi:SpoIIE family protein phosphatase [Actinophytocola sp.]|uniref:SpoIIE family protein phosphatase n=1 Tax=Actinophytocola sp. TaxID=1872138 RepID=UPI002D7FD36A|nr:SpoIIE family protein phosphatase [Actinophytocola sp.]HET9139250.1 SpoIIE family protein phosphatase [Actinophytocola sp.]